MFWLCLCAGMDEVDYNLYPSREEQLPWLRHFLEAKAKVSKVKGSSEAAKVTDKDVETLYIQVNKCTCVSKRNTSVYFQYTVTKITIACRDTSVYCQYTITKITIACRDFSVYCQNTVTKIIIDCRDFSVYGQYTITNITIACRDFLVYCQYTIAKITIACRRERENYNTTMYYDSLQKDEEPILPPYVFTFCGEMKNSLEVYLLRI